MKPRILIFCDFYLPGHKSGGGMWTVVNLVKRFKEQFEFHIVTRNHDGYGDRRPYEDVETGAWNSVGDASVFYVNSKMITQRRFQEIIDAVRPDIVYLNSVFCTLVVKFLTLRRRRGLYEVPVVLAPCGELSPAALGLKKVKKRTFLGAARAAGLYRKVIWKASAEAEMGEIRKVIGRDTTVLVAPDLPPREILPDLDLSNKPEKRVGSVSLICVTRITPMKNLLFLMKTLAKLKAGSVNFDIVGPVEDATYWGECQKLIRRLPENVRVNAVGPVNNNEVLERLTGSHFFVLPTLNENFGYVFVEAMASGCPLVISNRTIWADLETKGIGWNLTLENETAWIEALEKCVNMDSVEYAAMSARTREYAVNWLGDPAVEKATADVLNFALQRATAETR